MVDVPILILAAGASRRMRGRDKLLEAVEGEPLLRRQAGNALAVSGDVRIALPPAPHPRDAAIGDLPVRAVRVADHAEGIGASLRTVFGTLDQERRALLLLADLPALTAADLTAVLSAPISAPQALIWRGATQDGLGGHPMLIDRSLYDAFRALRGDDGGRRVVQAHRRAVHLVPLPGRRARLDVDTPEDWAAFRAGDP